MIPSDKFELPEFVAVESAVSDSESLRTAIRNKQAKPSPASLIVLLAIVLGVNALVFLIAKCASKLRNKKSSTAFLRRLAQQRSGESSRHTLDREGHMLRLPTYEEACGISTPSPTGGETLERGHGGAAGVSGWQPASSFAAGAKSKVLKVAKVIKTAISAAFSSPPDSPLEELYDFPNVLPGQAKSQMYELLGFVRRLGQERSRNRKRLFQAVFCGAFFEFFVVERVSSPGWPDDQALRTLAMELEGALFTALDELAARPAQSKSEATLTLSCNDDGITYGNVFVEVSAFRPPPYSDDT